ncbi:MAG: hypothetical protein ACRD0K_16315 [Egibacteraceae bacterium]
MSAGSGDRTLQRDRVERALADLVRDRGPGSVREPGTLRALLADYVGDQAIRCRPEIDLLVATAQAWASGQALQGADADWAQRTLSTTLGFAPSSSSSPPSSSSSPPPPSPSPPPPLPRPRRRGLVAVAVLAAFLGLGGLLIAGGSSPEPPETETPTEVETVEPTEVETLDATEVETLESTSESSAVSRLRAQLPFEFSQCQPFDDPAATSLNAGLADVELTAVQLPLPLAALTCDRPDDRFTHLFWLVPGTDVAQLLANAAAAVGADLGEVNNVETSQQTGWYFAYDSQIDESASLGYYLYRRPDVIAVILVENGTAAELEANATLY